jgi:hypothetical protein
MHIREHRLKAVNMWTTQKKAQILAQILAQIFIKNIKLKIISFNIPQNFWLCKTMHIEKHAFFYESFITV